MGRALDPDLQALIDGGHVESHTAARITLGDDTVVRFATGEFEVGEEFYSGEIDEMEPLKMSLTNAIDRTQIKIQNVTRVFGQQLTSAMDRLDGATAMLGIAFRNQNGVGPWYFDEKIPGDVLAGQIDENQVPLNFVGETYGAMIVGETVASVFPYQQERTPFSGFSDPNDLVNPNPGGSGGFSGYDGDRGRILPIDFPLA